MSPRWVLSIKHFHNLSKELQKKNLFRVIPAICKWFAYWKREKITAYLSISMRKEALKFCTKVQKMCGFWSAICNGIKWIEFRFLGTFAVNTDVSSCFKRSNIQKRSMLIFSTLFWISEHLDSEARRVYQSMNIFIKLFTQCGF